MPSATRITNLDFIRGVALLGILVINVISFGLPITALFNHSTYGAESLLDWIVIVISSVFFEYKMMGLFSMLFGVGLMIFLDNAKQKVKKTKNYFPFGEIFYYFYLVLLTYQSGKVTFS